MNENRPINLALQSMKFPPMAIASILHRISGMLLFLMTPLVLYFFSKSLTSEESFLQAIALLKEAHWKFLLWVFAAALIYHLLAGIRHLLMDFGWGESLKAGRFTAQAVIVLAAVLSIVMGIWLC